jgi:hypothetical protein
VTDERADVLDAAIARLDGSAEGPPPPEPRSVQPRHYHLGHAVWEQLDDNKAEAMRRGGIVIAAETDETDRTRYQVAYLQAGKVAITLLAHDDLDHTLSRASVNTATVWGLIRAICREVERKPRYSPYDQHLIGIAYRLVGVMK